MRMWRPLNWFSIYIQPSPLCEILPYTTVLTRFHLLVTAWSTIVLFIHWVSTPAVRSSNTDRFPNGFHVRPKRKTIIIQSLNLNYVYIAAQANNRRPSVGEPSDFDRTNNIFTIFPLHYLDVMLMINYDNIIRCIMHNYRCELWNFVCWWYFFFKKLILIHRYSYKKNYKHYSRVKYRSSKLIFRKKLDTYRSETCRYFT